MRQKILLIEPHPDDICLSYFHFLNKIEAEYFLLSLFWNDRRSSKNFCEFMGIRYLSFGSAGDILFYKNRIPPHIIKKQENPFQYQRRDYLEKHEKAYKQMETIIFSAVSEIKCDVIVTTLGLLHPQHVLASLACGKVACQQEISLVYFADFPYAFRRYGHLLVKDCGMKSVSCFDSKLKDKKVKVFEKYYPTESSILRWDRGVITNSPECVFSSKELA